MADVSREQRSIERRLRRIVKDAGVLGLALIADADSMAVRIMTREEEQTCADLRVTGRVVALHGGCGGGIPPQKTASGNG